MNERVLTISELPGELVVPAGSNAADARGLAARLYTFITLVGAAMLAAGLALQPQRGWLNVLIIAFGLITLGVTAGFFVALQYVSGAGWSIVVRRVGEGMFGLLWIGAPLMIMVLIAAPSVYPWTDPAYHIGGFKGIWLDRYFHFARAIAYFAIWIWLLGRIRVHSCAQDEDGRLKHTQANIRLSALFIVLYAVTFWLANVDWVMSLEPDWYSTMFGVHNFAGAFTATLALISIFVIIQQRKGSLKGFVNAAHLHDLGKLLFAFAVFWMYIWFSQYMLIWYANIPEETIYFTRRIHGAWGSLMLLNIFLNWVVPFLALMSSTTKSNPSVLIKVALAVAAGRWLELYLMIMPSTGASSPPFGLSEIGGILLLIGGVVLTLNRELKRASLIPMRDPYLMESIHHHQ